MNTLHFIPNFKASRISFDEILEAAFDSLFILYVGEF